MLIRCDFILADLHLFSQKRKNTTKEEFDKFIFPLNEFSVESRPLSLDAGLNSSKENE